MNLEEVKALPRAIQYPTMVKDLFKDMGTRSATSIHAVIGVLGEVGELVPASIRGDFSNAVEESGDVFFYVQGLMNIYGWDLDTMGEEGVVIENGLFDAFLVAPLSGMSYYAGNVVDELKKEWAYGKELNLSALKENLSKFLAIFSVSLQRWDLTFNDIMAHNQYKLVTGPNARYPSGQYSNEAAIARADKVEDRPMQRTDMKHVWRDTVSNKYHFSDEAGQIDPTPYDTAIEASVALEVYAKHL